MWRPNIPHRPPAGSNRCHRLFSRARDLTRTMTASGMLRVESSQHKTDTSENDTRGMPSEGGGVLALCFSHDSPTTAEYNTKYLLYVRGYLKAFQTRNSFKLTNADLLQSQTTSQDMPHSRFPLVLSLDELLQALDLLRRNILLIHHPRKCNAFRVDVSCLPGIPV